LQKGRQRFQPPGCGAGRIAIVFHAQGLLLQEAVFLPKLPDLYSQNDAEQRQYGKKGDQGIKAAAPYAVAAARAVITHEDDIEMFPVFHALPQITLPQIDSPIDLP